MIQIALLFMIVGGIEWLLSLAKKENPKAYLKMKKRSFKNLEIGSILGVVGSGLCFFIVEENQYITTYYILTGFQLIIFLLCGFAAKKKYKSYSNQSDAPILEINVKANNCNKKM